MRLSVKPSLIGHYYLQSDDRFVIEVENRGIGPAVLKDWLFWSEGSSEIPVSTGRSSDLQRYINTHLPISTLPYVHSSKKRGSILKVGELWKIFDLDISKITDQEVIEPTRSAVEQFCLQIRYASFYEDEYIETLAHVYRESQPTYI